MKNNSVKSVVLGLSNGILLSIIGVRITEHPMEFLLATICLIVIEETCINYKNENE
jgi:hypothetical protein